MESETDIETGPERSNPFHRVESTARIAVYDDLLSSPRIIEIQPDTTREYINNIASTVYSSAKESGGSIPYSIILQVAENFIHSYFTEVVVSVMDGGNTIRFSDQGPGIPDKEKAKTPGYSSATAEMKRFINGVGSGLPIVSEYIETMHGRIEIDDNLNSGAVVTISLNKKDDSDEKTIAYGNGIPDRLPYDRSPYDSANMRASIPRTAVSHDDLIMSTMSERGISILRLFEINGVWGVSEIAKSLELPASSVYNELKKLEEAGMITKLGKKRVLTEIGSRFLYD